MNMFILRRRFVTCFGFILLLTTTTRAGEPLAPDVLGHGPHGCCHVIDLLLKYNGAGKLHALPIGDGLALAPNLGDLQLVSVAQVAEPAADCGPTLTITICNDSERAVCGFSVSAVAVLRRIMPDSPTTTVRIEKVEAGESVEIQLQLPLESSAMAYAGGQPLGFDMLVVAIDSYDELVECDESNNLLTLHRSRIPMQVEAPAPAPEPSDSEASPEIAVPPGSQAGPAKPSPIDNLDIDNIDWGDEEEDAS